MSATANAAAASGTGNSPPTTTRSTKIARSTFIGTVPPAAGSLEQQRAGADTSQRLVLTEKLGWCGGHHRESAARAARQPCRGELRRGEGARGRRRQMDADRPSSLDGHAQAVRRAAASGPRGLPKDADGPFAGARAARSAHSYGPRRDPAARRLPAHAAGPKPPADHRLDREVGP